MFDRVKIIDQAFKDRVAAGDLPDPLVHSDGNVGLKSHQLFDLFDSQIMSRQLDYLARRTKGKTFYSIGSSGHEGLAALAMAARQTDMAFLHYRDGAFLIQRRKQTPGLTPLYDMLLSFAVSSEDKISGGRHKVLGCAETMVPPQTSTIASHLPKAVGAAHSLALAERLKLEGRQMPDDAIVLCSFGDASFNHSTAQGALNAAAWAAYQRSPMPIVFICEDNGIGISVRTPAGWVANNARNKPGLHYISCDGRDVVDAWRGAQAAVDYARTYRKPVFLHMQTVRLLGHAGADIEANYTKTNIIEAAEANDPLLHTARIMMDQLGVSGAELVARYDAMRERVDRVAEEALGRPKLESASQVMDSIIPDAGLRPVPNLPSKQARDKCFAKDQAGLKKPQPLAKHINYALADLMLQYEGMAVFGEDVARKGGVYGVTQGLLDKYGHARVFDTLLDEQTILGNAIGMAQNGFVPVPEIQFLAYLHNAEDQIRGEAATLSFFSNKQYQNPMVVRIAGLGYQKGFGGHFHNDNSLNVLRDIPGIIVACPSAPEDAGPMLRECVRLAHSDGRVVIFVEPIALYPMTDLHADGDKGWLAPYQGPEEATDIALGDVGLHGDGDDLLIITYGNGHYLSRQAAKRLSDEHSISATVMDLRWLQPLNENAIIDAAQKAKHILVVDECRRSGSLGEQLMALMLEHKIDKPIHRESAEDSFIALGTAANLTMPSADSITAAALTVCGGRT